MIWLSILFGLVLGVVAEWLHGRRSSAGSDKSAL
jgi:uncharacterized membrane protein YeaQ/YmgE (transglycosylase-associated protein family)